MTDDSRRRAALEPKQESGRDLVRIEIPLRLFRTGELGQGQGFIDGIAQIIGDAFGQPSHFIRGIGLDDMNQFVDDGAATVLRVLDDPVGRNFNTGPRGRGYPFEVGIHADGDTGQWKVLGSGQ